MDEQDSNTEFEQVGPTIIGHLVIRDAETGEVLVNKRDAMAQPNLAVVKEAVLRNE